MIPILRRFGLSGGQGKCIGKRVSFLSLIGGFRLLLPALVAVEAAISPEAVTWFPLGAVIESTGNTSIVTISVAHDLLRRFFSFPFLGSTVDRL